MNLSHTRTHRSGDIDVFFIIADVPVVLEKRLEHCLGVLLGLVLLLGRLKHHERFLGAWSGWDPREADRNIEVLGHRVDGVFPDPRQIVVLRSQSGHRVQPQL